MAIPRTTSMERRFLAFLHRRYPPHAIWTLAIFAASSVGYGVALLGPGVVPSLEAVVIAVVVLVLLSFQLAVADAARDQRHCGAWQEPLAQSPLIVLAFGAAGVQALLTMALHPPLMGPLAIAWLAITLASQDFFIPDLADRPALSVGLHTAGLASAGLYAAGADLFRRSGDAHPGLFAFMVLTIASGLALEFARKSEAPDDERERVQTYSKAWGAPTAGMAVATAVLIALLAAVVGYISLSDFPGLMAPGAILGAVAFLTAASYGLKPTRARADRMRMFTALFIATAFFTLGVAPWAFSLFR